MINPGIQVDLDKISISLGIIRASKRKTWNTRYFWNFKEILCWDNIQTVISGMKTSSVIIKKRDWQHIQKNITVICDN